MKKLLATAAVAALLALTGCSSVPTFTNNDLPPTVRVADQNGWILLEPAAAPLRTVGVVFYPGGLVKPEAYEMALAPLAARGFPVAIAKMPLDLAFFAADKGVAVKTSVPGLTGVQKWVIGGHSLGGVAAAIAVDKHPEFFAGIFFWASYPAKDNDLSKTSVPAVSVTASNDGLSTPAKVAAASVYLPPQTKTVVIEGGNHAQFGTYGPQKGDGTATISREEQQRLAAEAVISFLEEL